MMRSFPTSRTPGSSTTRRAHRPALLASLVLTLAATLCACASTSAPAASERAQEATPSNPQKTADPPALRPAPTAPARTYEVVIPTEARRLFEAPWVNEEETLRQAKAQHGDFTRLAFDVIYGPMGPYDEALLFIFEPERFEGFRTFILGHGPRGWEGHYVARLGPWESSQMLAVIFEEVGEARLPAPIFTATYLHDRPAEQTEARRSPEFPYTSVVVWDGESFAIDEALEERLKGRYEVGTIREGLRGE
ncbi:hypothetical protein FRC96_00110 [Lujinxingia vulgaris]|uniref:Lipoprotein n=1 Tax=Lujinxingia vulgaris TaxID=2600176 RepID=A0A5C6XG34_9DELT|nr:hypothetical protein [Lujinxingia vulgaris]TXD44763.1 hypothetical protein FRC96_00110 [Lujinxingia vulgaris]